MGEQKTQKTNVSTANAKKYSSAKKSGVAPANYKREYTNILQTKCYFAFCVLSITRSSFDFIRLPRNIELLDDTRSFLA
jgi:hypothetical protein